MTLGDDTIDEKASDRIDEMLSQKIPQDTGDDAPFRRCMRAGKQLGADIMTARVMQDINKKKTTIGGANPYRHPRVGHYGLRPSPQER